jgi:Sulfotransferase family
MGCQKLRIKGKIEVFTPTAVSGWLSVFGNPEDKVRLELLLDDISVATASAEHHRSDVAASGFGDGNCQFKLTIQQPLTEDEVSRLKLRIIGSDICLELPRKKSSETVLARNLNASPAFLRLDGSISEPLKVFMVGSPRSGTSVLLRAMQAVCGLRAHGESHVIPAVAKAVFHLRSYYERFQGGSADVLIRELHVDRIEEPVFDGIRAFYREIYGGMGWADKTPSDEAIYCVPLIRRIFPDAKILVTRRNGIEVVGSYRKKFGSPFRDACENWSRVMKGISRLRRDCPNILELDQFDLANDAEQVGVRIGAYLEMPTCSADLGTFLKINREDRLSTHDWNTRLPLSAVDWSESEKSLFVELCGQEMKENGYAIWL